MRRIHCYRPSGSCEFSDDIHSVSFDETNAWKREQVSKFTDTQFARSRDCDLAELCGSSILFNIPNTTMGSTTHFQSSKHDANIVTSGMASPRLTPDWRHRNRVPFPLSTPARDFDYVWINFKPIGDVGKWPARKVGRVSELFWLCHSQGTTFFGPSRQIQSCSVRYWRRELC